MLPFDCVVPFTSTCLPFDIDEQEPREYVVALVAVTALPFRVKVRAGHLPATPDTVPMMSTEVDGVDGGAGVGVGDGVVTTTFVLHVTVVPAASLAVHSTVVEPTGKSAPDAGEQLALTGATPPETVGLNGTITGEPFDDVAVGTGHRIASGLISGATPATC
jgi:hypothetical protein